MRKYFPGVLLVFECKSQETIVNDDELGGLRAFETMYCFDVDVNALM